MPHPRLKLISDGREAVTRPSYLPADHKAGIVHLGVGAFHRAHQAVYTDSALGSASVNGGGDWRIIGVSLRNVTAGQALNPQNGLFTVLIRGEEGTSARLIGAIEKVLTRGDDSAEILQHLVAPETKIVTLTVTEKAYGIDRANKSLAAGHAVNDDLKNPRNPATVLGLLTEALRFRRQNGTAPMTILCCDNLPNNGQFLRQGVLTFANSIDPELAEWIGTSVSFPSSMVDRITPASSAETYTDVETLCGYADAGAVEAEDFSQWVIEDDFPTGRPAWEEGGALFVDDVTRYEEMKLRMLNGAHSMLAYAGFLSGCKYVRDVMSHPHLSQLVARHMSASAATLSPLEGIDLANYQSQLLRRFASPAIAHETYQIAMDGTEKLPQRILSPALHAIQNGQSTRAFSFAVAAWMRYAVGKAEDRSTYDLRDPRAVEIGQVLAGIPFDNAPEIAAALHSLPSLFPSELANNQNWQVEVATCLGTMLNVGMQAAITEEASLTA